MLEENIQKQFDSGARMVEDDGAGKSQFLDKQQLIKGENILYWWMWMMRESKYRMESNPIRGEEK